MDHFISMYIDNELSLNEKILFLEQVHSDRAYKEDAVALLEQEKLLHVSLNKTAPAVELKSPRQEFFPSWTKSLGWAVAACLLVVMTFVGRNDFLPGPTEPDVTPVTTQHRFVLQHRASNRIEITGSFTNWQSIPLAPAGSSGYWEVVLDLPPGEHRYTFIIDGEEYLPDPTVPGRETDDYGSTNSILRIEA